LLCVDVPKYTFVYFLTSLILWSLSLLYVDSYVVDTGAECGVVHKQQGVLMPCWQQGYWAQPS